MNHFLLLLWEYMWGTFSLSKMSSSFMPFTQEVKKHWTDSILLIYFWSPGDQSWLQQSIYQRAPNGLHDAFSPPLKSSDTPSKQLRSSSLKLKSKICADLNNKIFEICFDFNIIFVWTKVLKSRRLPITRPKLVTVEVHMFLPPGRSDSSLLAALHSCTDCIPGWPLVLLLLSPGRDLQQYKRLWIFGLECQVRLRLAL